MLAPFASFTHALNPDPALAVFIAFNFLWQLMLMGVLALLAFSARFRHKLKLLPHLDRLSLLSKRALLFSGLIALPLLTLGEFGTKVISNRALDVSAFGSIAFVNGMTGLVWFVFLVVVLFGLLLQSRQHRLALG